jgi:ELWxxDGT repeat protein
VPEGFGPIGAHTVWTTHQGIAFIGSKTGLWRSDGTAAGTNKLASLLVGPRAFASVGSTLYFSASTNPFLMMQLWQTDGTTAGTVQVPGNTGDTPSYLTSLPGGLLLTQNSATGGREPWFRDDATSTIQEIAALAPASGSGVGSGDHALPVLGKWALFPGLLPHTGVELWRTNGTSAGTTMLVEINPGVENGVDLGNFEHAEVAGLVYFVGRSAAAGREPWVTDGTAAGTHQLADLWPGPRDSAPRAFRADGAGGIVFVADDVNGTAVYRASPQGIVQLADGFASEQWTGSGASAPIDQNGKALFAGSDGVLGVELWTSDGTRSGTRQVKDIHPGSASSVRWSANQFVSLGDWAAFWAVDAPEPAPMRLALWRTDGTDPGTTKLVSFDMPTGESIPSLQGVRLGNDLVFATLNGQLWRSDGTVAGTTLISSTGSIQSTARLGNRALVLLSGQSTPPGKLLTSDGTPAGTSTLATFSGQPQSLTVAGRLGYFLVQNQGFELWRTDGTAAGTFALPASGYYYFYAMPFGNRLLFNSVDALAGVEPWVTDGSAAGTMRLADVTPGPTGSPATFTVQGDLAWFTVAGDLWSTDGTPAGTSLRLPKAASNLALPAAPQAIGSRWVWYGRAGATNVNLVRTQGSLATVETMVSFEDNLAPSYPSSVAIDGTVFGMGAHQGHGYEFWGVHPGATATARGFGCAANGFPAELRATDPVLGGNTTLEVRAGPPTSFGTLAIGLPAGPTPFGVACFRYLDPDALLLTIPFLTDATGGFSAAPIAVPNQPELDRLHLVAQTLLVPSGSFGVELSNAVLLVLGD